MKHKHQPNVTTPSALITKRHIKTLAKFMTELEADIFNGNIDPDQVSQVFHSFHRQFDAMVTRFKLHGPRI